ncbi:amidohydrolase family protein [Konateibacter massiliensis]|uniref:amidohydrolase family protein n=1 Tax=Konateibacter massiliensis TaxID=2002841 RepID=UPI000C158361|nr:amidohydrolase family protein [Konateibacter massiliensis]
MVIDANMYWLPEAIFEEGETEKFLSEIPKEYGINGYLTEDEHINTKQITLEKPPGYQNLNYAQGEYMLETQIADMDEAGVEKAILKIPGCHEWLSLDTCKKFNDGMMEYAKRSKGRLIALAVVPPFASKACFEEIDRCRELGIKDFQLCAHYGENYLDSNIFQEFFEKLNEKVTTVYIHHTPMPVDYGSLYEYNNLRRSYGRCVDQSTAIGREIFSGFFDKYPNLTFVHSMLGGGFFSVANMMFPKKSAGETVSRFQESDTIKEQFQKHIYFEMSHAQPWGKEQLECAVSVLGADHIIFGTSYPVRKEWLTEGAEFVRQLNISSKDKELLLYQNAKRIYHLDDV